MILNKIFLFLKDVRLEIKKINWLTAQEILKYTLIVIGISFFVAVFLGTVDFIFTTLLKKIVL